MTDSSDRQLASSFARLPTELISRIARPLSTSDFCALRSTCKLVDHKLFNDFAYDYFRKKQFMMSTSSLEALKDIAASRFGGYLSHLIVGTDYVYTPRWENNAPWDLKRKFCVALDQQKSFSHVGCVSLIEDALAGLSNLETIDIRDFNSPTRFRDGQHAVWRSYGVAELRRAGNVAFGDVSWASCVFQNMLLGAAAAKAPIKNLEVLSRRNGCLQDSSLFIPKPLSPDMTCLLSGLTKLHLDVMMSWEDIKYIGLPNLTFLLQNTPNVDWLRLNFDMVLPEYDNNDDGGWTGFLAWLAKKPSTSDDLVATYDTPPTFRLKQLDLGRMTASPDHILDVVLAYPTLRTLSLSRVQLTESSKVAAPPGPPGNPYLVEQLLKGLDQLSVSVFSARALVQRTRNRGRGEVRWKHSRGNITDNITLRSESGRLQFKDAIDLISFHMSLPLREFTVNSAAHNSIPV